MSEAERNARIAMIARNLANALMDYAYTRKDDDKKAVQAYEFELCRAVKQEAAAVSAVSV